MRVSEIATGRTPQLRRVGITYDNRIPVMDTAVRIYRDLGIDLNVDHNTISIAVPQAASAFYMGLIERYTGHMAWNEWETP